MRGNIADVLADLEDSYLTIWDGLTPNQRKTLLAIARGERDLFSGEFAKAHDFASPASVQSALRKLKDVEVVTETGGTCRIADIFMEYWLRERFPDRRAV